MSFLKLNAKSLALLAVLVSGIFITAPYLNFQDYLSQGDHGRDLYAAQAVYRGELPYRDFWWVYGPLTPYYYGLFFKIFGTKISSMLLGKIIMRILGGLLLSLGLMEIASPLGAGLAGCWYMLFAQDFFFTYNHIAGVAMVLGVVWCLLSYINTPAIKALWRALGFVFILCLIKINFGLAALVMTVITVGVSDFWHRNKIDKRIFYLTALLIVPGIIFIIYYALLHGLSSMEIRQCLPYKEGDQPYSVSVWTAVGNFLNITWHTMTSNWVNLTLGLLINACALRTFYLLAQKRFTPERQMGLLLSLGLLGIFYLVNSHEYLKSGVWYRDFWAQPLSIMLSFLFIDTAAQSISTTVRKTIFLIIATLAFYCWILIAHTITIHKTPEQFISLPRGGIYVGNSTSWIATVEDTTAFLNKTLKPNELFFALPYDCLYYYLTDKKTPTRQLIFFDHIKIPPEQEKSIIGELEARHVNYILLSSRAYARQEPGLGLLGITYCPLIGKYIQDNFVAIAKSGDWSHEPGWAWNHGTMILKRKGT